MMDQFSITYRDFDNETSPDLSGLSYDVKRYSHDRYAGPKDLEFDALGSSRQLGRLLDNLGLGVVVTDNFRNQPVWWGRINEITFHGRKIAYTFSLDRTSNKTACRYSYLGDSGVTEFVEDTDSQERYGILELLLSLTDTSPEAALAYATSEHEFLRFPQPLINITSSAAIYATVRAESWLAPLQQRYYNEDAGLEVFDESGGGNQALGDTADNESVAMSFELSSAAGWDIRKIAVRVRKEGTPTDDLELHLMSDDGGAPDASLRDDAINGADIDEGMTRLEFEFSTVYGAAIGTTYWIELTRSGAADASNYYVIEVNEEMGADGEFLIYNGVSWATREPDCDMPYWIYGELETSEQISDILSDTGEFIDRTVIDVDSGIFSNQYRANSPIAYDEYSVHLDNGTDNDLRYFGFVDIDRFLTVDEEEENAGRDTPIMGADGLLRSPSGTPIPPSSCYIGWVRMADLDFIGTFSDDYIDLVSAFYVDEAEYRAGAWRPVATRGAGKIGDAMKGLLQG